MLARVQVLVAATLLLAACGVVRPNGTLADLDRWPGSATVDERGTEMLATYDNWPMAGPPAAYACTEQPAEVFGGADGRTVILGEDPRCAPFQTSVDGSQLRISIDRSTLPPAFAGLGSWQVVLAMDTSDGTWSVMSPMPATLKGLLPGGAAPTPTP